MSNNPTVLYFGVYDPSYARNWVLINGLKKNGVEVSELRQKPGRFALLKLFFDYLKFKKNYDAMIVGFPGQEVMFLARLLVWRKPIVFDAFTSHYGGYILDRKKWAKNSLRAKYFRFLDKWSCNLASVVLLDTNAHIDFFVKEFKLPKEKFRRIFLSTDFNIFYPREVRKDTDKFLIHFHGNYIPLQGVEYIIRAAKLLEKEGVIFNLIGQGQTYKKDRQLAEKLGIKNINFIDRVSYEKLADYINMADISLGIFGDTPKTGLVIPNKVYEAIACGKPVITADTPAIREIFHDRAGVLLCDKANPVDLANKIIELKNDPLFRKEIAVAGHTIFETSLRSDIVTMELISVINKL